MVKSFLIIILNHTIRYYLNELTLKKEEFKEKKLFVTCSGQSCLRLVYLPQFSVAQNLGLICSPPCDLLI